MDTEELSKTQIINKIKLFREQEIHSKHRSFRENVDEIVHSMLDNITLGIVIINPKMQVTWVNKTMKKWRPELKVEDRPLCYRSFYSPPKENICDYCPTIKAFKTGQIHSAESDITPNKTVHNIIATPVKNEKGEVVSVIETVENITKIKRLESIKTKRLSQPLKPLNRDTVELLAEGVAHELGIVIGGMENAMAKLKGDHKLEEYLEHLHPLYIRLTEIKDKLQQISSEQEKKKEVA